MSAQELNALEAELVSVRPEPASWWIAYRPRALATPEAPWTDLASGGLLGGTPAGSKARLPGSEVDDLIYLPPAREESRAAWDRWYERWAALAVVQSSPKQSPPADGAALIVYDLLQALLEGDASVCDRLPFGATVAWPLIAGVTDSQGLAEKWLPRLAARETERVKAFTLQLSQRQRRDLAERLPEDAFSSLFHPPAGAERVERRWARWIARAGMSPFLERPHLALAEPLLSHRRLSGVLLEVGDLWLRLGRSALEGQAFFRAAREVERSSYDLVGAAREGNLGVFPWLEGSAIEVATETLISGSPVLLRVLRGEYLSDEVEP